MKPNLFSRGDVVRHKKNGRIDTVKYLPGDFEYDNNNFFDADEGMLLEQDGWDVQRDWELDPATLINSTFITSAIQALQSHKTIKSKPKKKPSMATTMGNTGGNIYYGGSGGGSLGSLSGGGYITSNGTSGPRFTNGQRVVIMGGDEGEIPGGDFNPFWGKNGEYIAGRVEHISASYNRIGYEYVIRWDNGRTNKYFEGQTDIIAYEQAPQRKTGVFSGNVNLDTTKLDSLVIEKKVKEDILALLYQHKHSKKLFEDWGLGDVIEYGRGMTMMFYGPPGTGKTWGANCIAKALGKELLTLGAAEIQSSEPGGANRNIQNAFSEARDNNKVLFIDECDSLIQNRAHLGMILASEINTLLTEIEKFEGVVILASNRIQDMDPALERRLALIVEFPMPNLEQRMEIWKKLLPSKMPLHEDVKVEELAEMELSGGLIKNVVLQGARLAISESSDKVSKTHFTRALDRVRSSKGLMGKERVQTDGMSIGPSGNKEVNVDKVTEFFKSKM